MAAWLQYTDEQARELMSGMEISLNDSAPGLTANRESNLNSKVYFWTRGVGLSRDQRVALFCVQSHSGSPPTDDDNNGIVLVVLILLTESAIVVSLCS